MSVLLFFAVLFVLILVHEWGHFIVAKKTGMRVDEFGIGFPPKLFGIKKGETEYTFNALPIGGFVRIFGENAESSTDHEDTGRSFGNKSKWAQAAVLIAGVTMNILFAWLLFVVIFMVGIPSTVSENEATDSAVLTITNVLPNSPMATAGVPIGAVITEVSSGSDVDLVLSPSSFSGFIEAHADTDVLISWYAHTESELITTTVQPVMNVVPDNPEKPAVGAAVSLVEMVQKPFGSALYDATTATVSALGAITVGITGLLADVVRFDADFSQVAGPVGIVGMVGDAVQFGFTSLLMFTAFISLNLAVINMLPFPALDGGRLVMVAIEAVIRRPINPVWVGRVNLVGFALLILLMIAVTFSDVSKLL